MSVALALQTKPASLARYDAMCRAIEAAYEVDEAFVLCHKMREAMAVELKGRTIGGPGKVAEVNGGYVRPANLKANRVDRRFGDNQSGKRKAVVVIRERNGNSLLASGRKAPRCYSSRAALPRAPSFTPTSPALGTIFTAATK
jgi:hypothetical protein